MGVVSRRWVWVESMGVVVRRYRFPHNKSLLIPTPLVSALFLQQHPYFLFIFSFLFEYCFEIYVINNFFAQYKHIWATTGIPWKLYEGLHMFYTRRSTHK